jgi:catechol-2,3-dioxygenase
VIWGVTSEADLAALGSVPAVDPNGIGLGFRVTRKRPVAVEGTPANVWGHTARIDTPSPVYDHAEPVEVGHVVFFTDALEETTRFYEKLGFVLSDRYPGRATSCAARRAAGITISSCCRRPRPSAA